MTALYLIRHGQTAANEAHRYCGSTDLPLSETGTAKLHPLPPIPGAVYSTSGMRRTNETLNLLFGTVPYQVLPQFREIDFGVFEMHTYEELKDRTDYQVWLTGDNEANIPPNGESGHQMTRRVLDGLTALRQQEGTVVLITHGGVIAAIMADLFPSENRSRYSWQPHPGTGYRIDFSENNPVSYSQYP